MAKRIGHLVYSILVAAIFAGSLSASIALFPSVASIFAIAFIAVLGLLLLYSPQTRFLRAFYYCIAAGLALVTVPSLIFTAIAEALKIIGAIEASNVVAALSAPPNWIVLALFAIALVCLFLYFISSSDGLIVKRREPRTVLRSVGGTLPSRPAVLWFDDKIDRFGTSVAKLAFERFTLICASDTLDLMQTFEENEFDVVIIDFKVGDLRDTSEIVQVLTETRFQKVIILTGYVEAVPHELRDNKRVTLLAKNDVLLLSSDGTLPLVPKIKAVIEKRVSWDWGDVRTYAKQVFLGG